ncbi:hypothetical protein DNFV4_03344 [Nitrospira tepida]|uniref:Uncharacterized protein n=1 Tax=Nitrospira tepida TaxID=2973512 RepID=A0AA86TDZ2_9BACT|nr:hypothetical protein [Nitrospira tepida]CAI4032914.1 hypothetical protein DNFV4_03344 [Nitrospira tepida]
MTSPYFWLATLIAGFVLLFIGAKSKTLLNNTVFAVVVSILIVVSYLTLVDHYLMDMQGLDYWYLFRN